MSMMGVTPGVPVEVIAHVNEFFGDDDLDRSWLLVVDALKIDEHEMMA